MSRTVVKPFEPHALLRPLAMDRALRWIMGVVLVLAIIGGGEGSSVPLSPFTWNVMVILLAVVWVGMITTSSRIAQQLPTLSMLIERDPAAAEAHLAEMLPRRMLQRSVRLLLFQQLAALRHRQQRFAEAATICQTLLTQMPPGSHGLRLPGIIPAGQHVRAQLLLLLAEARLQCRDLVGAYVALAELHRCELNLLETLQRLALQTHYEVLAGHDAHALWRLREKILCAELMPAPQCGAMHLLLATAAERMGDVEQAAYLHARAELLCTPQQLESFAQVMGWGMEGNSILPLPAGKSRDEGANDPG